MAASLKWCPWARKMCKDGLTLCFNGEVQIPLKNAEIHLNALMSCKFFWNSSKMLLEDWYVLIQLRHSWLHHVGPFIVRHLFYRKNLDVKKRHCRKYIVRLPWPFVLYRGSTELLLLMFFNYLQCNCCFSDREPKAYFAEVSKSWEIPWTIIWKQRHFFVRWDMIYWWRGFQDGRRGKGDGENIDNIHISGRCSGVG